MADPDTRTMLQYIRDAMPGGNMDSARAALSAQAQAEIQKQLYNPENAKLMGQQILNYTLGGLGLGLSGTKLYHMISDINRQKPKYTKFGPGSKTIDADEKIASGGAAAPAGSGIYSTLVSAPGKLIQNISQDRATREGFLAAATALGFSGGVYGGNTLMNNLITKKRKEDLQTEVEDAKKEYLRALLSKKHAAALDVAFETVTKQIMHKKASPQPIIPSAVTWAIKTPFDLMRLSFGDPAYRAYIMATLSTGALAGKMTYDWTRARSRDKAVADAQKTRARMAGAQPLFIDPEQMASLKRLTSAN